jgi:hypothetical protein
VLPGAFPVDDRWRPTLKEARQVGWRAGRSPLRSGFGSKVTSFLLPFKHYGDVPKASKPLMPGLPLRMNGLKLSKVPASARRIVPPLGACGLT